MTTALEAAYAADPTAKLYINEYNIEYTGVKATALLTLVQALQAAGTPINGIGFQCHFIVGEVPASLQTVMEQFTALGLEVAVTELDIRFELPSTAALLAQQQEDYETVISVCKNVAGCVGVTLWDYTDKVRALVTRDIIENLLIVFFAVLVGSKHILRLGRCESMG